MYLVQTSVFLLEGAGGQLRDVAVQALRTRKRSRATGCIAVPLASGTAAMDADTATLYIAADAGTTLELAGA